MSSASLRSLTGKGAPFALAVLLASFVVLAPTSTPEPDPAAGPAAPAENHYIGAAQCRSCHKSPASGNQYGKWDGVSHSDAFVTLGTDAAKEVAKQLGVEDPQKDPKCLKCHVTGAGEPPEKFASSFEADMGVQCETCHGQGEFHKKTRFAAAANAK